MAVKPRLTRGNIIFIACLAVIVTVVAYFNAHPLLHPRLRAADVVRVRTFATSDRNYEWLDFDPVLIADLVDKFNAGVHPVTDQEPLSDVPHAGLLFILSTGNGITVSAPPAGASPGQVEVARGQYQYRLDAPDLAEYISGLSRPENLPASIVGAAGQIDAFLTGRGAADVVAAGAVCTSNGRDRLVEYGLPAEPLHTAHTVLSICQEEYSRWQINPDMLANVLVVSVEWQADLTEYGRDFLAGNGVVDGHGRYVFLLVRADDNGPWLIEDWE